MNSDGTELLPNVGSRKLPVDFRQALRYLWLTKTPKIYQYLFYRKGRSMIRSVVEIVAAICINSIGVALAAVGIETVEYGSSLQFLFDYFCRRCFGHYGGMVSFAHLRP
ncbi:hypothetical protein [Sinorhizobium meliloti]|uniref:hypothetical protein n=1 Tax=Rhizobium meliloti TaxID=382 RepID=UPI001F40F16E|nr:hypothetical protein [Sinorhizobium meliloti]